MNLDKLFRPKTIAVVGASESNAGGRIIRALSQAGYGGRVVSVNPKYSEVLGTECFGALADVDGLIDCAFLATPARTVPGLLRDLASARGGAAVIHASGFGESGADGFHLQREIADFARKMDIPVCGPNSMGLINTLDGVGLWMGVGVAETRGSLGVVAQSGGMVDAIRSAGGGIEAGLMVASGNEAAVSAAGYVRYFLEQEPIRAVAVVVEEVRDIVGWRQALQIADNLDKPVIILRLGASEGGRAAALAHTGSLAGNYEAEGAFFKRYGALEMEDLDELIEACRLLSSPVTVRGDGVALVGTSGGKAAYYADLCARLGLPLARLAPKTVERLRSVLDNSYEGLNPIDSGLGGVDFGKLQECLEALEGDAATQVVAIWSDYPVVPGDFPDYSQYVEKTFAAAREFAQRSGKAIVCINTRSARGNGSASEDWPMPRDVPLLQGGREGINAIKSLLQWRLRPPIRHSDSVEDARSDTATQAASLIARTKTRVDQDAFWLNPEGTAELLATYGVPYVDQGMARSVEDAVRVADGIGYPVVVKLMAFDALHKASRGLVRAGVPDSNEVERNVAELLQRYAKSEGRDRSPQLCIQRMLAPGPELFAGIKGGSHVGPVLLFGVGGTLVEALKAVEHELLPVDEQALEQLVARSAVGGLLSAGGTGEPNPLWSSVLETLTGLARLGWELRDEIVEVDLNPIILSTAPEPGACAVDCRIVVR